MVVTQTHSVTNSLKVRPRPDMMWRNILSPLTTSAIAQVVTIAAHMMAFAARKMI